MSAPMDLSMVNPDYTEKDSYSAPWRKWLREHKAANIIFAVGIVLVIICIITIILVAISDAAWWIKLIVLIVFLFVGVGSALLSVSVWDEVKIRKD